MPLGTSDLHIMFVYTLRDLSRANQLRRCLQLRQQLLRHCRARHVRAFYSDTPHLTFGITVMICYDYMCKLDTEIKVFWSERTKLIRIIALIYFVVRLTSIVGQLALVLHLEPWKPLGSAEVST